MWNQRAEAVVAGGVSVAALVAENKIENPSLIRPGQILKIPPTIHE